MRKAELDPSAEEARGDDSPIADAGRQAGGGRLRIASVSRPSARASDSALQQRHLIKRQAAVLESVVEFLDHRNLQSSLMGLAGELHHRFRCDRVAIGLRRRDGSIEVSAVSQQATIDRKSVEIRQLADAMREACDQDAVLHHHSARRRRFRVLDAHKAVAAGLDNAEICTLPLCCHGEVVGALLLHRRSKEPWARLTIDLFRQIAAVVAPMLALRSQVERSPLRILADGAGDALAALLGPRHVLAKISTLLLAGAVLVAYLLPVIHQVTADGELVPIERRIITAPVMGYVAAVQVRPGQRVGQGDLLVSLDTSDLELDRVRWENEVRSAETEFRSAMATYDRKQMAITQARQEQARAQLDLISKQIERASIRAPVDGVVVAGDLSQAIGAPVQLGETLLEITPGTDYEIHLKVDERDIGYVSVGQGGRFALAAAPTKGLPFRVVEILPIAEPDRGANVFRVKAHLEQNVATFRPGQTGVGKVAVGEKRLLWIWTHRFTEWMRLKWWAWFG